MTRSLAVSTLVCVVLSVVVAASVSAQRPPALPESLAGKVVRHPDLQLTDRLRSVGSLDRSRARQRSAELSAMGVPVQGARIDPRSGRWTTLLPGVRLLESVPGSGAPSWRAADRTPGQVPGTTEEEAWRAVRGWLEAHRSTLRIDLQQLGRPRVAVHEGGRRIQLWAPRQIDGVAVREASLTAVLSHGRLTLLGLQRWADVDVERRPSLAAGGAIEALSEHLAPLDIEALRSEPHLVLVPTAPERDPRRAPWGAGYSYRLAWVIEPELAVPGGWEALIDAHDGEVLQFDDRRVYSTPREVIGGVLPVSNDGDSPGGIERGGYPMPYADVLVGDLQLFTDGGGNLPICADGPITTTLDGRFVGIEDGCGPISETRDGVLDLGSSGGLDCAVPVGSTSPGNTHAARTAYYETNRSAAMARSHLPDNAWLQQQLTAVVNIPALAEYGLVCNAFWDETTINFVSSGSAGGGVSCTNTGELAGVISHEWGHGLDDNDVIPTISNPGEGIADVYAALRLGESCIGRGFFTGTVNNCGADDADLCLECDGVRDIDWGKRTSGQPHDLAWIDARCPAPFLGSPGPCGGGIHCEGAVYSEAIWDLVYRDLPATYGYDVHSALEIVSRLVFLGAGGVGNWYSCAADGTGTGDGCNADSGYRNLLAIDDDDGDLSNGTPHMTAIHAAFDRHGIACDAPTVQDSGCAGGPSVAPSLEVTPVDRGASLSWSGVAGAERYRILRADGEIGCDGGKVEVGETMATEWLDEGLLEGHEYFYLVQPVGVDDSCLGPVSSCVSLVPVSGPNLAFDPSSTAVDLTNGDLDGVIDNCEAGRVSFELTNIGTGDLSGVTITDVEVLSHPGTVNVTTPLPLSVAESLPGCGRAGAAFQFEAAGLGYDDELVFRVVATGDQLGGRERSQLIRVPASETNVEPPSTLTFDFESDRDGFQTVYGTFERSGGDGGAAGSEVYLASSSGLPEQCDVVRSPVFRLTPQSSLTLSTRYDIEPSFELEGTVFWFDRANVGLYDVRSSSRSAVEPDGGRSYEAEGPYGSCDTQGQGGWAGTASTWAESEWSSAALGTSENAGRFLQLDIRYGTDVDVQGGGFHFDEVVLRDVERVVPDQQADVCVAGNAPPQPQPDQAVAADPSPIAIPVLANDDDPDVGDALRVVGVTQPERGAAIIEAVGPGADRIVYRPGEGPGGADGFRYSVSDGRGGSAIADVTVDRQFLFYADFESGGFDAWSSTVGGCTPDGTFTLSDPDIVEYQCCLGLVSVDVEEFMFSQSGALVVPAPWNPFAPGGLQGEAMTCPAGSFSNAAILQGGCTETYTLEGSFTGPDSWAGTFSIDFEGADCSCAGLDPCFDQSFEVTATR